MRFLAKLMAPAALRFAALVRDDEN